jgi:hypothetical protein
VQRSNASADLASRVQSLMELRQQHAAQISKIDETLAQINALLGSNGTARRRGRPPKNPMAAAAPAIDPAAGEPRRRRKRRTFAVSGDESILEFVRSQKNPTTQEIKAHWNSEGRGGTADNALSKLVKDKKLKRTPLGEGIRGSRYALP